MPSGLAFAIIGPSGKIQNADLRSKRESPNVLYPGDVLFIPDKVPKIENRPTGQTHVFQVPVEKLLVDISLRDFDNVPIHSADCELEMEGQVYKLTTDTKGKIQQEIPKTAETGALRVPKLGLELPVHIGHLDPHFEDSGWQARLVNLGYLPDATDDTDPDQLSCALEEFQCDQKLKVTGLPDSATRQELKDLHGC